MRTRSRHGTLVICLLMLIPATAAFAADEGAVVISDTAEGRKIVDGDWVYTEWTEPLEDSTLRTIVGKRMVEEDGCTFEYSNDFAPNTLTDSDRVFVSREIAASRAGCVVVLESGFASADSALASDDLIWADAPVLPGVDSSLPKGPAALPGEGTLDAGSRVARWYKTAAEDPIFIDVNSVKSYLQWTRTGTTITSASGHGTYGVYQGTFSTWYKDYVYHYNTWNSTLATTYTYGKFYNWDFWDNDKSTWVQYNTNRINGYGNGGWTNQITRSKWGENNWLLHWKDSAGVWWL